MRKKCIVGVTGVATTAVEAGRGALAPIAITIVVIVGIRKDVATGTDIWTETGIRTGAIEAESMSVNVSVTQIVGVIEEMTGREIDGFARMIAIDGSNAWASHTEVPIQKE